MLRGSDWSAKVSPETEAEKKVVSQKRIKPLPETGVPRTWVLPGSATAGWKLLKCLFANPQSPEYGS